MTIQWGKKYNTSMKYGPEYCCPSCEWKPNFKNNETFGQFTVGIDSEAPPQQTTKYDCSANCGMPKRWYSFLDALK